MPKRSRSSIEQQARIILKSLGMIAEALSRIVTQAQAAERESHPGVFLTKSSERIVSKSVE